MRDPNKVADTRRKEKARFFTQAVRAAKSEEATKTWVEK
jgi:hypothetical protein